MGGNHNQVHQGKELYTIYAHRDVRFRLDKKRRLVIYSIGYKRNVFSNFSNEFLRS